jgi:tetrahydrodipicolinate N-succinyltransferase
VGEPTWRYAIVTVARGETPLSFYFPDPQTGAARRRVLARGIHLEVRSVDKFPPMLDYVIPSGVRIADAA